MIPWSVLNFSKAGRNMKKQVGIIATRKIALRTIILMLSMTVGCASAKNDMVKDMPSAPIVPQAVSSQPGSLWPGENVRNSLFTDNKARRVNDIVTIVVSETSTGTSKASTNTSRDTTTTAGIATLLGIEKSILDRNENMKPKIGLGGTSSNSLKGEGDTNRGTTLTARLTAKVIQVLDNGNLKIEGKRQVSLNAEDQYIVISGIIRPEDITTGNLIYSQYISDAKIYYNGDGVINEKMRAPWLTRVVDWVWPF